MIYIVFTFFIGLIVGFAVKPGMTSFMTMFAAVALAAIGWVLVMQGYLQLLFLIPWLPVGVIAGCVIRLIVGLFQQTSKSDDNAKNN